MEVAALGGDRVGVAAGQEVVEGLLLDRLGLRRRRPGRTRACTASRRGSGGRRRCRSGPAAGRSGGRTRRSGRCRERPGRRTARRGGLADVRLRFAARSQVVDAEPVRRLLAGEVRPHRLGRSRRRDRRLTAGAFVKVSRAAGGCGSSSIKALRVRSRRDSVQGLQSLPYSKCSMPSRRRARPAARVAGMRRRASDVRVAYPSGRVRSALARAAPRREANGQQVPCAGPPRTARSAARSATGSAPESE